MPSAGASSKVSHYAVSDESEELGPSDDHDDFGLEESPTRPLNGTRSEAKTMSKKKAPIASTKSTAARKDDRPVEEVYQKKTQLEHILLRPDTYIGSVERQESTQWVYDKATASMVQKNLTFVPGLFKIFDEILVNAADNKIRDPSMDTLKVDIERGHERISIYNNGRGIPIEMHSKEGIYVPELIFGHLLTSSNYDDKERKVTGGRNGYGAKLCNIFSTEFVVETADARHKKKYKQTFSHNMGQRGEPIISEHNKEDYTRITFKPDLKKFGMPHLDEDILALFERRVYDMAGCIRGIKVFLNGERIAIKSFKEYVTLFLPKPSSPSASQMETEALSISASIPHPTIVHERIGERWEVCVTASDGAFQQMSFVNAICTYKGGIHVNYITDQVTTAIGEQLKKKSKDMATVKPAQIKNQLMVFINCHIENPTFDSQTKEYMTLRSSAFGSECKLGPEFIKKVLKCGVVENVMSWAHFKQTQQLKKTDGAKRNRLAGIAKLDDANNAGTKNASKCTLIVTEGDSAKALAVSGLSVVGRDNYGVFPLRGKLLNVREATHKQILDNQEINHIKQILGLQHGQVYSSVSSLRYGSLMIMTDQDHDGSHIKGLVINFLEHFFPSLLRIPGFLVEFITPIVKATRGRQEIAFYTIPEYESWKAAHADEHGWTIKYYKGLGTSTAADARKYFAAMERHRKVFAPIDETDRQLVDMAFSKKRADERKEWLKTCTTDTYMDHSAEVIKISDFINKELILFSMADNARSIPSVVDGLKPGHRKILFSCFKRKLRGEIKVAQLAGYVSEHSAYHHGEQSLCSTIIGMAQNFVGSNNLNLLEPIGQFGTRLQGGKDAASSRYVFTSLSPFARLLFRPEDDALLKYLTDDGQNIEPQWYVPILPLVLVNGGEGIGTGWMTAIPNFNPRDIVANLHRLMEGDAPVEMQPWYHGFQGSIEPLGPDRFKISGTWRKIDDATLEISELPIGTWTQSYKEMLEQMLAGESTILKDYKEHHTDTTVRFLLTFTPEGMAVVEAEGIEKRLRLSTFINLNNLVCFDAQGRLRRYSSPVSILEDFYHLRLEYYGKRKEWLVQQLTSEWSRLDNRVRFIMEIIEGKLVVQNRKKIEIINDLSRRGYATFEGEKSTSTGGEGERPADSEREEDTPSATKISTGYDYLLSMPIYSLTREKVERLAADRATKEAELNALLGRKPKDLWRADLEEFMLTWEVFERSSAAISQMERAKTMKSLLAVHKGKGSSRATKKSTVAASTNNKKKKIPPSNDGIVSEPSSETEGGDLSEDNNDHDFVIRGKPAKRSSSILGSPSKAKAVSGTSKRNLGTVAGAVATAAEPVTLKTVNMSKATVSAVPMARVLTEDEINSLPLAERINYMLNRPSMAIPAKKQSTLDAHLSLAAPEKRVNSNNNNDHRHDNEHGRDDDDKSDDDNDEGLPPLTSISIAPTGTDKTAIKRRRVAALTLPSDDDE